ncbi:MAG: hypothetical protein CVV28_02230 [Methanobacteriales archaeon HGW-Methanobacteriales-1]|jgi:hypothetical protein|nr:MAG: hypothetical protein CVV28_02230 [Methanobacteriales archaeon HGW-Methanobacteriales-1]
MPPLEFIGAADIVKADIRTLIRMDDYLKQWPIHPEAMVNLSPEDDDPLPPTPPPFTSLHLSDKTEPPNHSSSGGGRTTLSAQGRVITFIPPDGDPDMHSLDELGERFDYIFRKSDLEDSFPNYIKSYQFGKSYLRPYLVIAEGQRKKMADTVTTEFLLDYEVIL